MHYSNLTNTKKSRIIYFKVSWIMLSLILMSTSCVSLLTHKKQQKASDLFDQAQYFFRQHEYPQALRLYQQVEDINPHWPNLNHRIALCYAKTRFYDKAREYLVRALAEEPDNPSLHLDLGLVYSRLSLLEEAEREYRTIIRAHPDYYKAYLNLGVLLISRMNREKEGIAMLEQYLKLAPHSVKKSRIQVTLSLLKQQDDDSLKKRKMLEQSSESSDSTAQKQKQDGATEAASGPQAQQ